MITKYIIPDNTQLLKISSFYVDLNDDINKYDIVKFIAKYVYSDNHSLEVDIICIQGINDENLVKLLIKEILEISNSIKVPVNVVPRIDLNSDSLDNSIQLTWNKSSENEGFDSNNIIISKYPIITTSKIILNDSIDEKLVGSKKAVIANINVSGYLVTVINIMLSEDYLGISNSDFRKYEIDQLLKYIYQNNIEMKKIIDTYDLKVINKNVSIICGNMNVFEYKNSKINPELLQIFRTMKALDTFRISNLNEKENIYTNISNYKNCYILLILNEMILLDQLNENDLLKYSFDKLGITVIKSYIEKNIMSNGNYPIETIFLLDRKEKKKMTC